MKILFVIVSCICLSCAENKEPDREDNASEAQVIQPRADSESITDGTSRQSGDVYPETGNVSPDSLVAFAKTLLGTPYLYASTDPAKGFDCSGFITYVFNHFKIKVPRSSVDFTNYGKEVTRESARPGDLILFTGTDSTIRIVGHMGIVEENVDGKLAFIHSTSGKAKGVVITSLGDYYMGRFVKVIRVFSDDLFK